MSGPGTSLLDNPGMQVLVCGSSGPLPDRDRASACIAVLAAGKIYVVDVGSGSEENLGIWQLPMDKLAGVLLTHFHSDHITELGEFNLASWVGGRTKPLAVYGPEGVQKVVAGFNQAYELSRSYRTAHHGADLLDPKVGLLEAHPFAISAASPAGTSVTVLDEDGLKVRAFAVDHEPVFPAIAYRFEYKGRSVVISGDTNASPAITTAAKNADVLFHDAMAKHLIAAGHDVAIERGRERPAHFMEDIPTYHASVVDTARVANEANAKLLVPYHLVPAPAPGLMEGFFLRGVDDVRPEGVELARDGMLIDLPPNSSTIEISDIDD